jgi:hypothetical protein
MTLRRLIYVCALAAFAAPPSARAAHYATANFSVEAPSPELAKKFGDTAEFYRREKALEWLGREMQPWPQRCPLKVVISMGGAGGATTFTFGSSPGRSVVTSRQMEITGSAQQLLHSVLPHEVTHTVLAEHFGRPVPRWADEGGSVLSENEQERYDHDIRCRELLNAGKGIRLRVLFRMAEYPRDMIVLYAQGYSITAYLVDRGGGGREGRGRLLQFLAAGMAGNDSKNHGTVESWNNAARQVYGFESADALEEAWLKSLHTPPSRQAAKAAGSGGLTGTPASRGGEVASAPARSETRSSAGPVPVLEPPVKAARGATPSEEPTSRPGYLPPAAPVARPTAPDHPAPVLLPPTLPGPAGKP